MIEDIIQLIRNELVKGCSKKGHPFRYFTFITAQNNIPSARTVVLRKVEPDFELVFYTDKRSKKIEHIKQNPNSSALFYHPKKLLQINLSGVAVIEKDNAFLEELWNSIPENSKKDYTTSRPPGTSIKSPDRIEYTDVNNFCVLRIKISKIEYLQLKRPNHIRAAFEYKNGTWSGQFLVP